MLQNLSIFCVCVIFLVLGDSQARQHPNILHIIVDDLRPEFRSYGFDYMITPNFDALAHSGTKFVGAYCNFAVCAPSRGSFMSGRLPDNTAAWSFSHSFRETLPSQLTIPEYFKNHVGYHAVGGGKIFHPTLPPYNDFPRSWTTDRIIDEPGVPVHFFYKDRGICNASALEVNTVDPFCELDCDDDISMCPQPASVPMDSYYDVRLANFGINVLQAMEKRDNQSTPFLLTLGFRRPHNNWRYPQTFRDLYDSQSLPLPKYENYPPTAPPISFFEGGFKFANGSEGNTITKPLPIWAQREARANYYGAVSFVDSQIGRVLAQLNSSKYYNNTIVVLHSDHGWNLGESNEYHKHSNRENSARVPLLLRLPPDLLKSSKIANQPPTIDGLVTLVDLFPTLAELAGAPLPNNIPHDGRSFVPLLNNPTNTTDFDVACSQYNRCPKNLSEPSQANGCTGDGRSKYVSMGYTCRTHAGWRATAWLSWNSTLLGPEPSQFPFNNDTNAPFWGIELYDHRNDTGRIDFDTEYENVAHLPENRDMLIHILNIIAAKFFRNNQQLQARLQQMISYVIN